MNRNLRLIIVLLVGVVAATLASFAAYRAAQRLPVREVEVATVQTVVAARPLPLGTLVTKEDVKLVAWPARSVIPGSFTRADAVVNRGVITPLSENEPVVESKLAAAGTGGGLSPTIPAGMRAISVKVNEVVGVAGFVVPGTRVDVLVAFRRQERSIARAVVTNVTVLAAGTRYDQAKAQKEAQPIPSTVVTLLVTPEDAERIALATTEGSIMLVLRNPLDTEPVATSGTRLAALMGAPAVPSAPTTAAPPVRRVAKAAPPPVQPPPPKVYVVETIRAAKRTEEAIR
jgi:pilus assembly protein CpaB